MPLARIRRTKKDERLGTNVKKAKEKIWYKSNLESRKTEDE
jgi:hypothetical protein